MSEQVDGRRRRYEHRRGEILDAATAHVLEHGVRELSLRKVSQTVGISHATLLHHFRTRDELVAEVVDQVVARALAVPSLDEADPDPLRTLWDRATADGGSPYVRLFLELAGMSMFGTSPVHEALVRSMRARTAALADGLVRAGCPPREAETHATWILGALRGLISDRFVTGDTARVDSAFKELHAAVARRAAQWRSTQNS